MILRPTTRERPIAIRARAGALFSSFFMIAASIFSARSGTASRTVGCVSRMFSGIVRRFSTIETEHWAASGTMKFAVKAKAWCSGRTRRKLSSLRTVKYCSAESCAQKLACVSIAPLLRPVVPEV